MQLNMILAFVSLAVVIVVTVVLYVINSKKEEVVVRKEFKTVLDVVDGVKVYMAELLGEITDDVDATEKEFDRLYARKAKLDTALKLSRYGIAGAKQTIKDQIKQFIRDNVYSQEVDNILGLGNNQYPNDHVMFEIILQHYGVRYGKDAMSMIIENYGFKEPKYIGGKKCYYISVDELHKIYEKENIKLSENDRITLLATLVFQLYCGFGILDTIRDMNIDGINIGTSGHIMNLKSDSSYGEDPEATESARGCWLYYKGIYIHLRYMNFTSEDEMKRIITMLVRYGSKGTLTEKRGYMVTTMADKSRLLAIRPGLGEHWACFMRKFTLKSVTVQSLIDKPFVKNAQVVCNFLKYLMLGQMTSMVTGRQGSGKTTLMSAMIEYVDRRFNIRVIELAPELYLRELYPDRNIYSAQETAYVSAEEIQSAFKKSDAAFSLVGEVADSVLAARFIEMSMIASLFGLASHHANTTRGMVLGMRNALVDSGAFSSMDTAEAQVLECIRFNVHLDYTPDGKRYVDFIEEVVPLNKREYNSDIPETPERKDFDSLDEYNAALKAYELKLSAVRMEMDKDYYTRRTDREDFRTNRILHYDLDTDTYVADNLPTPDRLAEMKSHMEKDEQLAFTKFLISNWSDAYGDDMIELEGAQEVVETGNNGGIEFVDDDDELLAGIGGSSVDDMTEQFTQMNDMIDSLKQRDKVGFKPADESDVFGDFMTDEEKDEQMDEVTRRIAEMYAPKTKS